MKSETTSSRVVARPTTSQPLTLLTLLMGSVYGLASGLVLALILLSGLVPSSWAEGFAGGPFAFQGLLSAGGAVLGMALAYLRLARNEAGG